MTEEEEEEGVVSPKTIILSPSSSKRMGSWGGRAREKRSWSPYSTKASMLLFGLAVMVFVGEKVLVVGCWLLFVVCFWCVFFGVFFFFFFFFFGFLSGDNVGWIEDICLTIEKREREEERTERRPGQQSEQR